MTRALFYVQHLLGIGHLARASAVASALAEAGMDVVMVTGGMPVPGFPGAAVRQITLPPVTAADAGFSGLAEADGRPVDVAFLDRRRDLLLKSFADYRPDMLIVEAYPFGRRQMRFELLPLLSAARAASPHPLIVSSIRDILQERAKAGRNEESAEIAEKFFDLVLVHGDPSFVRLEETFPLAGRLGDRVRYTGLVARPGASPSPDRYDIVVSAGGGAAGGLIVRASAEAARLLDAGLSWCLITGPNLPQADIDMLAAEAPATMKIERFRPDFAALLAACRLSVSQAGYNTACDVLQAGCRVVLVPFAAGGETEQTQRAERLARRGLARVVSEDGMTGKALADAIRLSLDGPTPPAHNLSLDGAERSAAILWEALDSMSGRSA